MEKQLTVVLLEEDPNNFIQLMKKKAPFREKIKNELNSMDEDTLSNVWSHLKNWVERYMASALAAGYSEVNNGQADLPDHETAQEGVHVLLAITEMVQLHLEVNQSVPVDLTLTVSLLHGILCSLHESQNDLKNKISLICELWWRLDHPGKDFVMKNVLNYLLKKSLLPNPTKASVIRIWKLRDAFSSLGSSALQPLLEKCVAANIYLRTKEGRKFTSYIFSLDAPLTVHLHNTIADNIEHWTLDKSEWYGQIYLDAWKTSSGEIRKIIEEKCIQGMMWIAIHSPREGSPSQASVMCKFLSVFHKQKLDRAARVMLCNLYDPILWSSFKVANGLVRLNAALIFFDCFPIDNPDLNVEGDEILFNRNIEAVMDLLKDPYPPVRAQSTSGICVQLCNLWSALPLSVIHQILKFLFEELSSDSNSVETRIAVVKGGCHLLSNELTHPILGGVLSLLRNRFHDTSQEVRLAMCNLLVKIKKDVKTISHLDVVPIEHYLGRLGSEKPFIAKRIVELIQDIYMPLNAQEGMLLAQCQELVSRDRLASRVFYQHLHLYVKEFYLVRFMVSVGKILSVHIDNKEKNEERLEESRQDSVDDEENKENSLDCLDDPEIILGFVDSVAILWLSIKTKLEQPKNATLNSKLVSCFSKAIPKLLHFYNTGDIWNSIIYLSSFLPPSQLTIFSSHCLSRIKSLPENCDTNEIACIVDSMANHKRLGDVLQLIVDWIAPALKLTPPSSVKKGRRRRVRFVLDRPPKPLLACQLLEYMLEAPLCSEQLFKQEKQGVNDVLEQLALLKNAVEERLKIGHELNETASDAFLCQSFVMYLRYIVALNSLGEGSFESSIDQISQLVTWANRIAIAEINTFDEASLNATSQSRDYVAMEERRVLCIKILTSLLTVVYNMIMAGIANESFCKLTTDFSLECLKTDSEMSIFSIVSRILLEMTKYMACREDLSLETVTRRMSGELLHVLASSIRLSSDDAAEKLKVFIESFQNLMLVYNKYKNFCQSSEEGLMHILSTTVIQEITLFLQKNPSRPNLITDFPQFVSEILRVLIKKDKWICNFLRQFTESFFLEFSSPNILPDCMSLLHLLSVLAGEIRNGLTCTEDLEICLKNAKNVLDKLSIQHGPLRIHGSEVEATDGSMDAQNDLSRAYSLLNYVHNAMNN